MPNFALSLALLSCLAFPQGAAADRSGEPALRALMDRMAALRHVHVSITWYSRSDDREAFEYVRTIELWKDGARFRVVSADLWGGGLLMVSDGVKTLRDVLDEASGLALYDRQPTIYESHSDLALRGQASSVLYYLLAGSKALDALVAKGGSVKRLPEDRGLQGFELDSTWVGKVRLRYEEGATPRVTSIEFDNREYWMEQARLYPDWVTEPTTPLEVQQIRTVSVGKPLDARLFHAEPDARLKVQDMRAKKKGAG